MPRSLANGDYSLLMAIESSSRANSWYRVLVDRTNGSLSCDCPSWIFKQKKQTALEQRSCDHTRMAEQLVRGTPGQTVEARRSALAITPSSLISATQQQWPGLRGQWSIDGRVADVNGKSYQFILLRLVTDSGVATGVVAFALRHQPSEQRLQAGVAGWGGYSIGSEVARRGGYPMAGQPPEHFRIPSRARRPADGQREVLPKIGLGDILKVGDQTDLGDGLSPIQRAENTLRLFLGEDLYQQLETTRFLDVSSVRHTGRVYRVRRDPNKQIDRRIRVFEDGKYINDFCVVRAQDVPEADHFLTVFLGLLSGEESILSVVKSSNVFEPYSEFHRPVPRHERETVPAIWQRRIA